MNTHHLIPRMICAPFVFVKDFIREARGPEKKRLGSEGKDKQIEVGGQ